MEEKRRQRRTFWLSLGTSLFLFLTTAGLVAVDYQGRKLSFGDSRPPFQIERREDGTAQLFLRVFGAEETVDVTELDKFWHFLCDFGCIPHK